MNNVVKKEVILIFGFECSVVWLKNTAFYWVTLIHILRGLQTTKPFQVIEVVNVFDVIDYLICISFKFEYLVKGIEISKSRNTIYKWHLFTETLGTVLSPLYIYTYLFH